MIVTRRSPQMTAVQITDANRLELLEMGWINAFERRDGGTAMIVLCGRTKVAGMINDYIVCNAEREGMPILVLMSPESFGSMYEQRDETRPGDCVEMAPPKIDGQSTSEDIAAMAAIVTPRVERKARGSKAAIESASTMDPEVIDKNE